jgi:hypothetical protein
MGFKISGFTKNHIALFKLKQYIVQKKEYFDNDNDIFFKEFEWRKYVLQSKYFK